MHYSKITAIVRPERVQDVVNAMKALNVPGLSISRVRGYGEYANFYLSDWMCQHARIELYIDVEDTVNVVNAISSAAHTGVEGDGIIAVQPVESLIHISSARVAVP